MSVDSVLKENDVPVAVSLFSGLGGIDIGLHQAGIQTAVCIEKEQTPAKSLIVNSRHHSDRTPEWVENPGKYPWKVLDEDIREITGEDILNEVCVDRDDIDLVVGGPPCQTFSRSNEGNREGTDSSRGRLYEEYARIVQSLEPAAFLFENVRGLVSSNDGDDLEKIKSTLNGSQEPANYEGSLTEYGVNHAVLNCADYGIPQTRKRLFILGLRSGDIPTFPKPTHSESPASENVQKWETAETHLSQFDIDEGIEAEGGYTNAVGGEYGSLLRDIPEGANYQHFSERRYDPVKGTYVERTSSEKEEKVFDWRSRHWNYLLKLDRGRPSWTIQAKPGTYVGPFHWRSRPLSQLEQMCLMSIPLDYVILGDKNAVQKQIGNALPPKMAAILASDLLEQASKFSDGCLNTETVKADGGQFSSETNQVHYEIESDLSPWRVASNIVSQLQHGETITMESYGREIATTLDIAEIARRQVNFQIDTEFEVWEEKKTESKSDVISVMGLKLNPR